MAPWFDFRRNPVYRAERSEDRRGSRVLLAALGLLVLCMYLTAYTTRVGQLVFDAFQVFCILVFGVLVPLWVVRHVARRFEKTIPGDS